MDEFKIHQINNTDDQYFDEFWRIYIVSFPLIERRTIEQQSNIIKKSGYVLQIYIFENQIAGLISFWKTKEFIFIEHFAISPELRNRGIGNAILKHFSANCFEPIILEIELPVDKITQRRLHFYESLHFKMNDHLHCQPPYHKNDEPVPMKILSYHGKISSLNYQQFTRFQNEIVLGNFE